MFPKIMGFPPKSSILIGGFSIINHPFLGFSPYFLETPNFEGPVIPSFGCLDVNLRDCWGEDLQFMGFLETKAKKVLEMASEFFF